MFYYHIIDHDGFGTMHKLIKPLTDKYKNHILINRNKLIDNLKRIDTDSILIFHTSGGGNPKYINNLQRFKEYRIFLFLHTSYNFQKYKRRKKFINLLKKYSCFNNIKILVPSTTVEKDFKVKGILCRSVQIGIGNIETNNYIYKTDKKLSKYYDRIITTCSSPKDDYKYIKGIDVFTKIILKNKLREHALILGINDNSNIESINLNEREFLNVLYHSKMYIQFSRMETYNVTAIQAKRLKVPVLLLRAEGNYDCMKGNIYNSVEEVESKMLQILKKNLHDNQLTNDLYNDRKVRESISKFKKSLEEIEI